MNLGKILSKAAAPATPATQADQPNHLSKDVGRGPLQGNVGVGIPQHFDPNNPTVALDATIHNPTGIGGDFHIKRDVAIPTELPDFHIPSFGSGNDDGSSGFGGFDFPSLSGISLPDISLPDISMPDISMPDISMPSFSLPSFGGSGGSGFSLPDLPSFSLPDMPSIGLPNMPSFGLPDMPSFGLPGLPSFGMPDIGLPGMPGFRFPDLPKFELPSLDLSDWDLSLPDLIPDWGGDSDDERQEPHKRAKHQDKVTVEITLKTDEGDSIPNANFVVYGEDDWKTPGSFGKESKVSLQIPKGDYQVMFGTTNSVVAIALGRRFKKALNASDKNRVLGSLAASYTHLKDVENGWSDLEPANGKTFSMAVRAVCVDSASQNWAEIFLGRAGLGSTSVTVYGLGTGGPSPEYILIPDAPEKVLATGRKLSLRVASVSGGPKSTAPSGGRWSMLKVSRLGEPAATAVDGPAGGVWNDIQLDTPGTCYFCWTGTRPSDRYVAEIRVVGKTDPAHALPLRSGSLEDVHWAFEAAKRFREAVHRIAEDQPPEDSKQPIHQREWDQLTAACERLAGSAKVVSPGDAAILEPLLVGLKTPLREEPLSDVAWSHLFTISEPSKLRLPATQARHHPDALTIAWHLAALSGKKDPIWKPGAKIKAESVNGRFLGAVHKAEVQGVVVPDAIFADAKKIVESDSKTPCQKLTELLSLVSRTMTSSPVGTISIQGDSGDLDKLIHKTGMLSRDVTVSTWLEDLSDEDESFDWTQSLRVDGSTKKRKHDITTSLTFVEGEPIGWNPDSVPLNERGPKGEIMVTLLNHYLESTANLEVSWSVEGGDSGKVTTDANGRFPLKIMPGLILLRYQASGIDFCDQFFLVLDPVETLSGKWQRLSNLGYIHELLASNDPHEVATKNGLAAFAVDSEIDQGQESELLQRLDQHFEEVK